MQENKEEIKKEITEECIFLSPDIENPTFSEERKVKILKITLNKGWYKESREKWTVLFVKTEQDGIPIYIDVWHDEESDKKQDVKIGQSVKIKWVTPNPKSSSPPWYYTTFK